MRQCPGGGLPEIGVGEPRQDLGLKHLFTFGTLAFFERLDGKRLALMSQMSP